MEVTQTRIEHLKSIILDIISLCSDCDSGAPVHQLGLKRQYCSANFNELYPNDIRTIFRIIRYRYKSTQDAYTDLQERIISSSNSSPTNKIIYTRDLECICNEYDIPDVQ